MVSWTIRVGEIVGVGGKVGDGVGMALVEVGVGAAKGAVISAGVHAVNDARAIMAISEVKSLEAVKPDLGSIVSIYLVLQVHSPNFVRL